MNNKKVNWLTYEFTVYDPETTTWNETAGIYIFCGPNHLGQWVAQYIGQADSFKARFANHDQWAPAVRLGATHVHAMVVPLQANRDAIEEQLIQYYQPPLNVQLK